MSANVCEHTIRWMCRISTFVDVDVANVALHEDNEILTIFLHLPAGNLDIKFSCIAFHLTLRTTYAQNMILEVLTNGLVLDLRFYTCLPQYFRVANAGQLENRWRMDGSAGNDDFLLGLDRMGLSVMDEGHASSFISIKIDFGDSGAA